MRISGRLFLRGRNRSIELADQRVRTLCPCSGAVFGPQSRLARRQVAGLEQHSFDFCQRIFVARRIEIIDQIAAYFRNRRAVRSNTKLSVRKALRDRQSPALAKTRKEGKQAATIGVAQFLVRQVGHMCDLAAQVTARREVHQQVLHHPADLPGEDQDRYCIRAVPLYQSLPHTHEQPMVFSNLDGRNEQHIRLRKAQLPLARGDRSAAQVCAEPHHFDTRQRPSGIRRKLKQRMPRMLRDGEDHIRVGYHFMKPFLKLDDVPIFDQRSVFNRNHIVNQNREPDPVPLLGGSDMLYVARETPGGAKRHNDIAGAHALIETVRPDCHIDQVAHRGLGYPKEKSRMADDHAQHVGEFAPRPRWRPNGFPWSAGTRRIQICRHDGFEPDRPELPGVYAEPAKPHASLATIESFGFDKDLERYALQSGRITEVIEITEKIFDFEPHDWTLVAGTITFSWLVGAVQAEVPDFAAVSASRH